MIHLLFKQDKTLYDFVERSTDYIVISQTAAQNPKIHKIDRLLRGETFNTPGIAIHKNDDFEEGVIKVCRTVKGMQAQTKTVNAESLPTHEILDAATGAFPIDENVGNLGVCDESNDVFKRVIYDRK